MTTQTYRADVDGLRAVAVGAVVAYHAFPKHVSGGFVGVDVFFVISGFLITGIIYNALHKGTFSFSDFWARRVRRIFPSLLVVIAATLLLGWFYLLSSEFEQLQKHVRYGLSFVANFRLNSEAGYFDTASELKPLLHLWSLAIEEQFYLVWPLFVWLLFRQKANAFLGTLAVAVFSYNTRKLWPHTQGEAFYFPWTRFWELQVGALLAVWNRDYAAAATARCYQLRERFGLSKVLYSGLNNAASVLGLGLIAYATFHFSKSTPFPSRHTLFPVLGAAILIAAGSQAWVNRFLLSLPPMRFVGLISFPIYLWHWPLLAFARIVLGEPSPHVLWGAIVASVLLSVLTYFTVEKFMRFEVGRIRWRVPVLCAGLCAGVVFVKYAGAVPRFAQYKELKIFNDAFLAWNFPTKAMERRIFSDNKPYYELNTGNPKKVLFIGDSHMEQYGPAVEKISIELGAKAKSSLWVTGGGYLFAEGVYQPEFPNNKNLFHAMQELLNSNPSIDTVVVGQYWEAHLEGLAYAQLDSTGAEITNPAQKLAARKQAIAAFFASVVASGRNLVLLQDIPTHEEYRPTSMFTRSLGGFKVLPPVSLSRSAVEAARGEARAWLQTFHNPPRVIVLDVLSQLCTATLCPTRDSQGRPLYKDHSHFAAYAAKEYLTFVSPVLTGVLFRPAPEVGAASRSGFSKEGG